MKGKTLFSREHLRHHADTTYFAPDRLKALMAAPILALAAVASVWLAGWLDGLAFWGGLTAMYLLYERLHRRTHTHAPRGAYSRWTRKHHMAHHFNCPKMNHGVTSPLWDLVFGTFERVDVVRVPAKHAPHAMAWLLDPATGDVRPEYQRDYVVRGPAKRTGTAPASAPAPADGPGAAAAVGAPAGA
jgi:4-hydroxysphinganine ceramide fatty acyl 2-hydroxylase